MEPVWTGDDAAIQGVVAMVDGDQDNNCYNRSHSDCDANDLAFAWTDGAGGLAARG